MSDDKSTVPVATEPSFYVASADYPSSCFGAADLTSSITLYHEDEVLATGADPVELAANVKAALTEARKQGAAERDRELIKMAEQNANSEDCLKPDVTAWNDIAEWLRSQKEQHHDK